MDTNINTHTSLWAFSLLWCYKLKMAALFAQIWGGGDVLSIYSTVTLMMRSESQTQRSVWHIQGHYWSIVSIQSERAHVDSPGHTQSCAEKDFSMNDFISLLMWKELKKIILHNVCLCLVLSRPFLFLFHVAVTHRINNPCRGEAFLQSHIPWWSLSCLWPISNRLVKNICHHHDSHPLQVHLRKKKILSSTCKWSPLDRGHEDT